MKTILYIISLLLFLSACETTVEFEIPEHETALVVQSHIKADENLIVHVSNSLGINDTSDYDVITDAHVDLYENGDLLSNIPYNAEVNRYELDIGIVFEETAEYHLEVSATGYPEAISVKQSMPVSVPIKEVTFEEEGGLTLDGDRMDEVIIKIEDPGDIENYYAIELWNAYGIHQNYSYYDDNDSLIVVDTIFEDRYMMYASWNDPLIEDGWSENIILRDNGFNGQNYNIKLLTYPTYRSDYLYHHIEACLISITEDRFYHERSLYLNNESEDNPLVQPVLIHNNIENGHGVFSMEAAPSCFIVEVE